MLITLRKQNITIQNRQAILRNRKLCYPATSEQSSTRYGLSSRVEETGRENPNQGHASKQESKQGQGLAFRAMSRRQGMSIQTRDMHASKQASEQASNQLTFFLFSQSWNVWRAFQNSGWLGCYVLRFLRNELRSSL